MGNTVEVNYETESGQIHTNASAEADMCDALTDSNRPDVKAVLVSGTVPGEHLRKALLCGLCRFSCPVARASNCGRSVPGGQQTIFRR